MNHNMPDHIVNVARLIGCTHWLVNCYPQSVIGVGCITDDGYFLMARYFSRGGTLAVLKDPVRWHRAGIWSPLVDDLS